MGLRKLKRSRSKRIKKVQGGHGTIRPEKQLQLAQQYLQQGRLQEAEKEYKKLVHTFPDYAAAYNDLGVLYHGQGNPDKALTHYQKAISLQADTPQALTNSGIILLDKGEMDKAILLFEQVLDSHPHDMGALTNLGTAQHRKGLLTESISTFKKVLELNDQDIFALNNLAVVFKEQERYEESVRAYQKIIDIQPTPDSHHALGLVYRQQGQVDKAIDSFQAALAIKANHVESLRSLGMVYTKKMEFSKAIGCYEKLVALQGEDVDSINKLAILQQKLGNLEQALFLFRKALTVQPDFLPARVSLVETLERHNRIEEAYDEALAGLTKFPHDVELQTFAATCERRLGNIPKALERLGKINTDTLNSGLKRQFFFELGRLEDRSGGQDRAFSSFLAANLAAQELNRNIDKKYFLNRLHILHQQFDTCGSLPEAVPTQSGQPPVFLVGFPRSGTTLLDQVLDSHPQVQTMEEKDIVAQLENKTTAPFENYISLWQTLPRDRIVELQQEYFRKVSEFVSLQPNTVLIDRMPLNIMRVALIWRIFPDAKFILAVRHPLDVCLSCFMQDFRINTANANFFTVEDAAYFYAEVMKLWQLYTSLLPIRFHMVRYEDLVMDLEKEARSVINFLAVEWDERALDFHTHARTKKRISTASYHQVTQPIYQHARYRWQRYSHHLKAAKEKLTPFIEHFGYSDTDL